MGMGGGRLDIRLGLLEKHWIDLFCLALMKL